jgi:hypothetical protein
LEHRKVADPEPIDEFSLERENDQEIWVNHRASGHVYEFTILDDAKLASEFTIVPNLNSTVDAGSLETAARRAALEYLKRLEAVRKARRSTGSMGTDDAAHRAIQQGEAARRRFIAATTSQTGTPPPAT